jgi:hypothetical protein
MTANGNFDLDQSNVFHDPANPEVKNTYQGVFSPTGEVMAGARSWTLTEVPLVITSFRVEDVTTSLTIGPGVVVKGTAGAFISVGPGAIQVQGTATAPVTFTSFQDDGVLGDTNADGGATAPTKKDWDGIWLTGGANSSIDHAVFKHCGSYWGTALELNDTRASVTNSTFAHNFGGTLDVPYGALDASGAASGTVITGNTFYDNDVPLRFGAKFSLGENTFHDPANPLVTNTWNAAVLSYFTGDYELPLGARVVWSLTGAPIVLQRVTVSEGASLTVSPGVTLKFRSGGWVDNSWGGEFKYTGATLTSISDDAHGGDTNNDGASTGMAWDGIYVGFGHYAPHDPDATVEFASN